MASPIPSTPDPIPPTPEAANEQGPPKFSKRQFLVGAVAGGCVVQSAQWIAASLDPTEGVHRSFAQSGEDLIVNHIFVSLRLVVRSYLDIGAWEPIKSNNTYWFYRNGARGVLVEPNPDLTARLRDARPKDTVLPVGIGVSSEKEADYYRTTEPSWNTFDKETADTYSKVSGGKITVKEVIKVPLMNINDVFTQNFNGEAPDYISLDVEGFEVPILKSINFEKLRPKVICVETLVGGTTKQKLESVELLTSKGYVLRGATFPNSILVDGKLL
ncbi:MAG: FkbM family methyltransferase [Planctomycetes bacterium]|nr:FkbM family methyltransferase [Planctomycetota bacterium]